MAGIKATASRYRDVSKKTCYRSWYSLNRWLSRVRSAAKIKKIDAIPVPHRPGEIRAFMVVRNESLRLPFMLRNCFSRGIDRIFVIDNDSSDDTASIILHEKNTHLFSIRDRYAYQAYWIDLLLRRYGIGHWCLVVDADEALIYPHFEELTLRDFCSFLDSEQFNALDCILLDMYPRGPLNRFHYMRGTDPLLVAPWFDTDSYTKACKGPLYIHEQKLIYEGVERTFGGMRKRVFGANPCLSKIPLIKFSKSMFLSPGTHFAQGARVPDIRGALLHFKYLHDFSKNVEQEAVRGQHWQNAKEYKQYWEVLNCSSELEFWAPSSTRFAGSQQLVALGIMKSSDTLDTFAGQVQSLAPKD